MIATMSTWTLSGKLLYHPQKLKRASYTSVQLARLRKTRFAGWINRKARSDSKKYLSITHVTWEIDTKQLPLS